MISDECQFSCLQSISEGKAQRPAQPFRAHLIQFIRRNLSPKQNQSLTHLMKYFRSEQRKSSDQSRITFKTEPLKAGDLIRVRSKEHILSTLDNQRKLRGCTFLTVQEPYCGTVQRVMRPMDRFMDEADSRLKKCKGLILLEGVICPGTQTVGRCDRSCFLFWREEWLEKVNY